MTIKVYEVNRDGGVRVVREEAEVVPLAQPMASSVLPDCACPRCLRTARTARQP
ncbi:MULTISPECIES: hypothetical protein [Streptomyces]|uniref:Uncharacterized protein n=1 Tax=Streptomyces glycanivorans TaxID=3033808 RepID=A0ABY9JDU9_9ACTN|nr:MULTISPECIES: hypothetical protein [unclassified Streptomyces]WSQ79243.1 hypothetical protein OG725_20005 [Streptomyces sp. NBC_01213]WLQ65828.1 hypothetical protein P8A20_20530 [Streptomyces sp. Alt3]WSQ86611.1 hypothetical protein OG722_20615 [Streptomyces sp. NBC_01212]WSR07339.1 hypothetical protein OG265_15625 [Streptomyces sp. NBC_01208]WSR49907.1 hypothetical protein OG279_20740 [Streptomyces sp. NBC_01201]